MPFADTIRTLPYVARTATASGFLPPMVRAMGHIIYLVGCNADEAVTVTDEDALGELRHAQEHWNARNATPAASTAAHDQARIIATCITEAIAEYPAWTADQRTQNLRDLGNRLVAHCAFLDRELVGITDSDPGSSL